MLLAPVIMVLLGTPTARGFVSGAVLVVLGQLIRIWAAGHLVKSRVLTVSGPFRWVRNPLYIGTFFITCGYCSMTGSWLAWVIFIPVFILLHWCAVIWEERFLLIQFGEAFERYCREVPGIIPRGPRNVAGKMHQFSFEQVLINKEHKAILGVIITVAAFAVKLAFWPAN
ncbi:MAG TPA: isoprenylcysteine carboxylmethyltransferase family protein [Armatimonadota bacterium]|nr:isoprenylcysteine carboxylmethyltransferase family protein [Armatimonadota bacterium]